MSLTKKKNNNNNNKTEEKIPPKKRTKKLQTVKFLNVGLKKKRHVGVRVWVDFEKKKKKDNKQTLYVVFRFMGTGSRAKGGWGGQHVAINRMWVFAQASGKRSHLHDEKCHDAIQEGERRVGEGVWQLTPPRTI